MHRFLRGLLGSTAIILLVLSDAANAQSGAPLIFGDQSYQVRVVVEGPATSVAKVEWKNFTAGSQAIEALQAGAIDAAMLGDGPALFAASKGVPIKLVAVVNQTPQGVAILVPAGSTVKTLAELKGKKVAIWPGSWSQQLAYLAFTRENIPLDAPQFVRLAPIDAAAALSAGKIDAMSTWEPYVTRLEAGGARALVDGTGMMKAPVFILVRESVLRARPKDVETLLGDLRKGYEWQRMNPGKSAEAWSARSGVEPKVAVAWFTRAQQAIGPITPETLNDLQKTADFLLRTEAIRVEVNAALLADQRFTSLLR